MVTSGFLLVVMATVAAVLWLRGDQLVGRGIFITRGVVTTPSPSPDWLPCWQASP